MRWWPWTKRKAAEAEAEDRAREAAARLRDAEKQLAQSRVRGVRIHRLARETKSLTDEVTRALGGA